MTEEQGERILGEAILTLIEGEDAVAAIRLVGVTLGSALAATMEAEAREGCLGMWQRYRDALEAEAPGEPAIGVLFTLLAGMALEAEKA